MCGVQLTFGSKMTPKTSMDCFDFKVTLLNISEVEILLAYSSKQIGSSGGQTVKKHDKLQSLTLTL